MSDSFPSNSNNTNIKCNVTIINSEFNSEIVNQLISTTENRLKEISNVNISKISVPGAYEIPFIAKKIIERKSADAIICIGAIIRGETTHYDLIGEKTIGIDYITLSPPDGSLFSFSSLDFEYEKTPSQAEKNQNH